MLMLINYTNAANASKREWFNDFICFYIDNFHDIDYRFLNYLDSY